MKKLTIKDIAKMTGFSPTVVSFVINNKEGVNEQTRKKILDVIEKNNFKPNLSSRRLILKKSFNVSIVIKKLSSPFNNLFYFEIAQGLLDKSKEYGYNIVFTDIPQTSSGFVLPDIIEQKDTDGVIFFEDIDRMVLNELEKRSIPFVIIDAHADTDLFTCIKADYEVSAYTATSYLIKCGHKDIAFISSSYMSNFYTQIFSGFKKALDENGLSIPSSWIQMNALDEKTSYECMNRILGTQDKPTAIFCATDMFAISAMKCVRERGFKVPEDVSFVSIDDILMAKYVDPPLTTIRIDKEAMGYLAMEMIIKKINGEQPTSSIVPSDQLIIRDSVRKMQL